jgi:hypothetical protein
MHSFLLSASTAELSFIAGLDYGLDKDKHFAELQSLIFERQGEFRDGELWFPLEVIELGSNSITQGHEREFVICCLLVVSAIDSGHCFSHDRESKYSTIEPLLSQLPEELASLLTDVYSDF